MDMMFSPDFWSSPFIQAGLLVLVLFMVWVLSRFVLRLAMRIFSLGCSLIVLLGVLYLALKYFNIV